MKKYELRMEIVKYNEKKDWEEDEFPPIVELVKLGKAKQEEQKHTFESYYDMIDFVEKYREENNLIQVYMDISNTHDYGDDIGDVVKFVYLKDGLDEFSIETSCFLG